MPVPVPEASVLRRLRSMNSTSHSAASPTSSRRRIALVMWAGGLLLWSTSAVADVGMLAPQATVSDLCHNGKDDDGDGLIDNADPDCQRCGPDHDHTRHEDVHLGASLDVRRGPCITRNG